MDCRYASDRDRLTVLTFKVIKRDKYESFASFLEKSFWCALGENDVFLSYGITASTSKCDDALFYVPNQDLQNQSWVTRALWITWSVYEMTNFDTITNYLKMLFRASNKNQQVPVQVAGLKRKGNATHKCFIRSDIPGLDRTEALIRNDRNVKDLRVKERSTSQGKHRCTSRWNRMLRCG